MTEPQTILVISDLNERVRLREILEPLRYRLQEADTFAEACAHVESGLIGLVLARMVMTDENLGLQIFRWLEAYSVPERPLRVALVQVALTPRQMEDGDFVGDAVITGNYSPQLLAMFLARIFPPT